MASTIQIKRGTGSAVPSGLADGELAINLDNRRLYFGSGSTSVNDFSFGEITAEKYIVSSSVLYVTTSFSSGSTEFGDTADDTHTFTGNITASGNISSSGNIITDQILLNDGNKIIGHHGTDGFQIRTQNTDPIVFKTNGNNIRATISSTGEATFTNVVNATKLNTGQGDNELYAMNQDVETTDNVLFNNITASGNVSSSGDIYSSRYFANEQLALNNVNGAITLGYDNTYPINIGKNSNPIGIYGPVTASGHISASGNNYASEYYTDGYSSLNTSGTQGRVFSAAAITGIQIGRNGTPNKNIELLGPVTASSNISASGTITANSIIGTVGTATQGTIDHDSLANFVANEHIDHSGVSITAGAGLTGGGTIAATRDIAIGAGTGVTVNANDVAIGQDVATTANVLFNNITASGDISSSGRVYGDRIYTGPLIFGSSPSTDKIRIGYDSSVDFLEYGKNATTSHFFKGTVTASSNISASGTITANSIRGTVGTATQGTIDHDSLANFVANEHIDHSGVSVIAGTGLTGGGTIAANRTLNVIGGTGVTANANDIAIGQDVATTANVLFNNITASSNISASLNSKLYASSASFGGAAFLRSFNVKGAGLEGRLSLQGASTNDNPGIEMTVNDNTSRVLMRLNPIGSNGTELAIFTEPDGGSIAEAITVESDGNLELNSHDIKGVNKLVVDGGQDEVLKLNTTSATGNPFIDFSQNGSRKSFIQHNDTNNTLKIASEFGAISLQTATDGNQTERVSISNVSASFTVPVKDAGRTIVKILPHNFVPNDGGRPVQIEDDSIGSNELFLHSHSDFDMYAYIEIPYGMTATHVKIFGSNTGENFTVYEANFNTKTIAAKCSATAIESEADITDVPWTDANYLVILVTSAGVTDEIHGGYVKIEPS